MTRDQRQRQLTAILNSPVGRFELVKLLHQYMDVPPKKPLPIGTPIVQTILDHEFVDGVAVMEELPDPIGSKVLT
jgi:hypothetical protein